MKTIIAVKNTFKAVTKIQPKKMKNIGCTRIGPMTSAIPG